MLPIKRNKEANMRSELVAPKWSYSSKAPMQRCLSFLPSQVEDQEVLAITFTPDKAVAGFPSPEEPVELTKGRTPKPIRRGGMAGRAVRSEVMSIPETAAGEYED